VIESLRERGLLVEAGSILHRYPVCWRCRTPLLFRVVDDWFISADEVRQPMLEGNSAVEWQPPQYKKRMDDWLRNMGDWNISRRRYFGLPLPFYECECGTLNVVGSRAELEERAVRGLDQLEELHRPWIDGVAITCESCGEEVERIPEVGDAWLDAGIVHFSTLGWQNPEWIPGGYATGASKGLSGADLPDNAYWEQWFPADWVSEMRQQIRLWFYSQCFMSFTLVGEQPYRRVLTYETVRDENGREMHKSWGNAIDLDEALERMGADVMRWLYCEQNPSQDLRFGFAAGEEVKKRLLTFWNSVAFFTTYARIDGFDPEGEAGEPRPLDRWLAARTAQLVRDATAEYERYWTPGITAAFERFVDDLSNWYIRRSRPRFWNSDPAALRALWDALRTGIQVIAPIMPFLAEYLWRNLVSAEESVFLAGWPQEAELDEELLAEIAQTKQVVELGRQARDQLRLKLRQPLRSATVGGAPLAERHADEIKEELRVKEVVFEEKARVSGLKPNLPVLGPRLGKKLPEVRAALETGEYEDLGDGRYRAAGEELGPDDVLGSGSGISVVLDTELDDALRLEGRVNDLVHEINSLRKREGYEVTDRIVLTLPQSDAALLEHEERIKDEVLAVRIETDSVESPQIAKA
jgi:isoleucyl-tRNA synthetase